jgi:cell division protease FtsH
MAGNDRVFLIRHEAKAKLVVALAGRAAEELLLDGDFTQGPSGDLESATSLAMQVVTRYGMTGTLSVYSAERYAAGGSSATVDAVVETLLGEALESARALLDAHRDAFDTLVGWLLEDETVDAERLHLLR